MTKDETAIGFECSLCDPEESVHNINQDAFFNREHDVIACKYCAKKRTIHRSDFVKGKLKLENTEFKDQGFLPYFFCEYCDVWHGDMEPPRYLMLKGCLSFVCCECETDAHFDLKTSDDYITGAKNEWEKKRLLFYEILSSGLAPTSYEPFHTKRKASQ